MDDGLVQFKGAAFFINNEKTDRAGGTGAGMFSSSQVDEPMVFSGPVLFKGNIGLVSEDNLDQLKHISEVYARASFMLRTTVDVRPQNRPPHTIQAVLLRCSRRAP